MVNLYSYQYDAVKRMHNGCVLVGGMGSGKSLTALSYYFMIECRGEVRHEDENGNVIGSYRFMTNPKDLVIITTARKRDTLEWDKDMAYLNLNGDNLKGYKVYVDSWNNIEKYKKMTGAFFIFDEQHVKGNGTWVKTFLNIARKNRWVLLSATPGDKWKDYIPVFVANGFYKNKTEFVNRHFIYSAFTNYPKVIGYLDEPYLEYLRSVVVVQMNYEKKAHVERIDIACTYDKGKYRTIWRDRWDIYDDCPIQESGKLLYLIRRVVNEDESRIERVKEIIKCHKKVIIFYNYTYELNKLRQLMDELEIKYGEWNGEVHSDIPSSDRWAYLVQYTAGSEGWNCTKTNVVIFYSLNYSYSTMMQAEGRVDRLNTPFEDLYYYRLKSSSPIDLAILRALKLKEDFNKKTFLSKR